MIKPTKLTKVKGYLTVLGYEHNSTRGDFEQWENKHGDSILLCVNTPTVPVFTILTLLHELNETAEAFIKITNVIT